jgi:predicted nucleotidyltransferase
MEQVPLDPLTERLTHALEPRSEILEAYLFGSRGRGREDPVADVDVAVYLDPAASRPYPFGYAAELSTDLMGALPGNTIDVVVLNQAPPLLYHRVLRDGIRLLARRLKETTTREGAAPSRRCTPVARRITSRPIRS